MIVGTFYGPTLGVFTLGAMFPFANAKVYSFYTQPFNNNRQFDSIIYSYAIDLNIGDRK